MPDFFPKPNTSTGFRSIIQKNILPVRGAKGSAKSPSQLGSKLPIQDIIENSKKIQKYAAE